MDNLALGRETYIDMSTFICLRRRDRGPVLWDLHGFICGDRRVGFSGNNHPK